MRAPAPATSVTLGLLAVAVSAWMGPAPGQEWSSTPWEVLCYSPEPAEWHGPEAEPSAEERRQYQDYKEKMAEWAEEGRCRAERKAVERELEAVSRWLDTQGYGPPKVPVRDGAYLAAVIPQFGTACRLGRCVTNRGFYQPGCKKGAPPALLVTVDVRTLAHELFHAVQFGYGAFEPCAPTAVDAWIREGTSEAVGLSWAAQGSGHSFPYSDRSYSERLHRDVGGDAVYDDEVFWRAVSRLYDDGKYSFLIPVFEALERTGTTGNDALQAVDEGLDPLGGLWEVYPRVIAEELDQERFYGEKPVP